MLFEEREELGIEDDAVLDDLGEPGAVLAVREGLQDFGVDEHTDRLVKGPDQVLPPWMIDPHLAPDRTVDVGQQRRRHLHERETPGVGRGEEAGRVPHDPASHGDHDGAAVDMPVDQDIVQIRDDGQRFGSFARRNQVELRVPAGRFQALGHHLRMRADVLIADDDRAAASGGGLALRRSPEAKRVGEGRQLTTGDDNVVAPVSQGHVDNGACGGGVSHGSRSCPAEHRVTLGLRQPMSRPNKADSSRRDPVD